VPSQLHRSRLVTTRERGERKKRGRGGWEVEKSMVRKTSCTDQVLRGKKKREQGQEDKGRKKALPDDWGHHGVHRENASWRSMLLKRLPTGERDCCLARLGTKKKGREVRLNTNGKHGRQSFKMGGVEVALRRRNTTNKTGPDGHSTELKKLKETDPEGGGNWGKRKKGRNEEEVGREREKYDRGNIKVQNTFE